MIAINMRIFKMNKSFQNVSPLVNQLFPLIKVAHLRIQWQLKEYSVNNMFWVFIVYNLLFLSTLGNVNFSVLVNFRILKFSLHFQIPLYPFPQMPVLYFILSRKRPCLHFLSKADSAIFAHNPVPFYVLQNLLSRQDGIVFKSTQILGPD